MVYIRKSILFIVLLSLLIPISLAWTEKTHNIFAEEVCYRFQECIDFNCTVNITTGSYYPIEVWRDFESLDLYKGPCVDMSNEVWCDNGRCQDCREGSYYIDRTSLDKKEEYLRMAATSNGCQRYFNVVIAGCYYLEGKDFWNQVTFEKDTCSKNYYENVQSRVENNIFRSWFVESCGIELFGTEVKVWFDEFIDETEEALNQSAHTAPPTSTGNDYQPPSSSTNLKCSFKGNKYLAWLCSAGTKTEEFSREKGVNPTPILVAVIIILIIIAFVLKKRGD